MQNVLPKLFYQVTEQNKAYKDNFQETFNFLHRNTQWNLLGLAYIYFVQKF